MNVSEAVLGRRSVRAFLDTPVPRALIEEALTKAARSPSGGNVQPWQLYLMSGEPLAEFKALIAKRVRQTPMGEPPLEYDIYPKSLKPPYRDYRYKNGEDLYGVLGIPRDQRPVNYYQLLGISPNESNVEVIEDAATRQSSHVRTYQLGNHAEECQRLLNEISQAKTVEDLTNLINGAGLNFQAQINADNTGINVQ